MLILWEQFWVCIQGTLFSTTLITLLPAPLLFFSEVALSILQNAVRLASMLLQLLHSTCCLVGRSNPISRSFLAQSHLSLFLPLPSSTTVALESCTYAVGVISGLQSDPYLSISVWLSAALGQKACGCCNVTLVAVTNIGFGQNTKLWFLKNKKKF